VEGDLVDVDMPGPPSGPADIPDGWYFVCYWRFDPADPGSSFLLDVIPGLVQDPRRCLSDCDCLEELAETCS
jgi:hypothetical protein